MATKTSFICLIEKLGEFQSNLTEIALTLPIRDFSTRLGKRVKSDSSLYARGHSWVTFVLHVNGVLVVMAIIIKKHVHPTSLAVLLEADGEQCPRTNLGLLESRVRKPTFCCSLRRARNWECFQDRVRVLSHLVGRCSNQSALPDVGGIGG